MTLTAEDTKTIKSLLNELNQEITVTIERKINATEINLERSMENRNIFEDKVTVVKLRKEIQTSEDNLKQILTKLEERILKRFDGVDKVLDDLVQFTTEDVNEMHEDHETRIRALEQSRKISV